MDRKILLESLPPYQDRKQLIRSKQKVVDIINEILEAHELFADDYNRIALYFDADTTKSICNRLYGFCKRTIRYKVEPEESQTTKSPAAILTDATGDCKHYASFCGGVLDALNRNAGKKIKWSYRFASYSFFNQEPEHIFVVVDADGKEIWIDPTPGADKCQPVWIIDKKIKVQAMPLYRISGTGVGAKSTDFAISDLLEKNVNDQDIYMAIQTLFKYGVMDANGKIHDNRLTALQATTDAALFDEIVRARYLLAQAAVGGLFDSIWHGIKTVTLTPVRNAFLSLVGINAFGYARKLKAAIYNDDGSFTTKANTIKDIWQRKFAGSWTRLLNTVNSGANKKAILGVAPAVAPWVATASAIVLAIMPLVNAFLRTKEQQTGINYNVDPTTGLPYGQESTYMTGATDPIEYIKSNPLILAGGVFLVWQLTKKK